MPSFDFHFFSSRSTKDEIHPVIDQEEHVFRLKPSALSSSLLWLAGGVAAIGVATVGFAIAMHTRVDQFSLQVMTTLPAVLGAGIYPCRLDDRPHSA